MVQPKEVLDDVEKRIKLCLKDTIKKREEGMPPNLKEHWNAEVLGYKTSLECVKRTREKFLGCTHCKKELKLEEHRQDAEGNYYCDECANKVEAIVGLV